MAANVQKAISIPEPTNKVDALWNTTKFLKEAVETIQGIRGNREYTLKCDFDELSSLVAGLEIGTGGGGTPSDEFVTSMAFNTSDGVLTLQRNLSIDLTESLDGRYALDFGTGLVGDMLYYDGAAWIATNGDLQWDEPNARLELAHAHSINWMDSTALNSIKLLDFISGAAGDPFFDNVVLLAKFDGADGATAYTELARSEIGLFTDNAELDTAFAAAGSASALFDGTDDVISFGDNAAAKTAYTIPSNGDATVEGFIRFASLPTAGNEMTVMECGSSDFNTFSLEIRNNGGTIEMAAKFGIGNFPTFSLGFTPTLGVFYHIAAQRRFDTPDTFVDLLFNGVVVQSIISNNTPSNDDAVFIGAGSQFQNPAFVENEFDGWIDSVRYTNGTARYSSSGTYIIPDPDYPESGVGLEQFIVGDPTYITQIDGSSVNIAGAYNIPVVDGTEDQHLVTDGAGVVSFEDIAAIPIIDTFNYQFSTDTNVFSDPGAGFVRINNAAPASATFLAISIADVDGVNIDPDLTRVNRGYTITIRNPADPTQFARYSVTGLSNQTTYWRYNIFLVDSGSLPTNNADVSVQVDHAMFMETFSFGSITGTLPVWNLAEGRLELDDNAWRLVNNGTTSTLGTNQNLLFSSNNQVRIHQPFNMLETSNNPSNFTTYGQLWVRDDDPNTLMFTDGEGADYVVSGADATHTGEVTGDVALTVDVTSITNRSDVVASSDDDVAIHDDTDGTFKKVNLSSITDAGYF